MKLVLNLNRSTDPRETMAYWLGALDEVDREIDMLQGMKSKRAQAGLERAKALRKGIKNRMAELSGLEVQS